MKYAQHVDHLENNTSESMGLWAQYVGCVLVYKYVEITYFFFRIDQDGLSSIKNQLVQGYSPMIHKESIIYCHAKFLASVLF